MEISGDSLYKSTAVFPPRVSKNSAGSIFILIAWGLSASGNGYQEVLKIFAILLNWTDLKKKKNLH